MRLSFETLNSIGKTNVFSKLGIQFHNHEQYVDSKRKRVFGIWVEKQFFSGQTHTLHEETNFVIKNTSKNFPSHLQEAMYKNWETSKRIIRNQVQNSSRFKTWTKYLQLLLQRYISDDLKRHSLTVPRRWSEFVHAKDYGRVANEDEIGSYNR